MFKNVFIYLFLLFLVVSFCSSCQKNRVVQSEPDLEAILHQADSLFQARNDTAMVLYNNALPLLKQRDDLLRWLVVQRRVSIIVGSRQQKRAEALDLLKNARDTMALWRKPESDTVHYLLALLYMREARTNLEIGDNVQMKECLERTEKIFKEHLYGKYEDIAWYFFSEMANVYTRLGEFENAEQLFQESLQYEKTFGQKGIASHNDYGSTYLSQGNYQAAVAIFQQGLSAPFVDTFTQTMLLLNLSEGFLGINELAKGQTANDKALPFLQKKEAFSPKEYAQCQRGYLENKAIIAEKKSQWAEAAQYYRATIAGENAHSIQRREKAAFIANEANAWFQLHQYDTALVRYHEAYLQFYPALQEKITDLPNPADLLTDKILADAMEGKALCFAQMSQYDLALALYERIPVVEAQLRATHTFESSSLFALGKSRKRFDAAVELAWKAWQTNQDDKYANQAFQFTEMARGILQTKGIQANDAYSALDEGQKVKEKSFSTRIAAAETELAEIESNDDPKVNAIMQSIRDLKREQKEFRTSVMKTNQAYAAEMSNESICPVSELSSLLREGQVMIDYYLVDSLVLHVFVADKQGNVAWHRTDWSAIQQQALNSFVFYLGKKDEEEKFDYFAETSFFLYQSLLAPLMRGGTGLPGGMCKGNVYPKIETALLIVPDLALAGLSFEALLTDTLAEKKWSELSYVVKKHSIGYAYSASLLQLQQNITRKHASAARIPFAGFAPTFTKLVRLDSAEADVKFGQQQFGGKAYTGTEASEEQFRKIAEDAQILLFSMHGISNHRAPALSKLYFGDSLNAESNRNNVLTAGELQNIPCRADLAVLSACKTGDGPVEKGEGVYSLARAFTISGVPSTVVSLWLLPNVSSSNMVQDFLAGIKRNEQKDIALRTAKLKWLKDGATGSRAHPYYWACFVTAGDMSPLVISGGNNNYWYWLIPPGIVILLLGLWRRNRKKRDA